MVRIVTLLILMALSCEAQLPKATPFFNNFAPTFPAFNMPGLVLFAKLTNTSTATQPEAIQGYTLTGSGVIMTNDPPTIGGQPISVGDVYYANGANSLTFTSVSIPALTSPIVLGHACWYRFLVAPATSSLYVGGTIYEAGLNPPTILSTIESGGNGGQFRSFVAPSFSVYTETPGFPGISALVDGNWHWLVQIAVLNSTSINMMNTNLELIVAGTTNWATLLTSLGGAVSPGNNTNLLVGGGANGPITFTLPLTYTIGASFGTGGFCETFGDEWFTNTTRVAMELAVSNQFLWYKNGGMTNPLIHVP